jgi:hypothetical protein
MSLSDSCRCQPLEKKFGSDGQPVQRVERDLQLTRAPLVLDRPQRQAHVEVGVPQLLDHIVDAGEPDLGEVLVALLQDADLRRRRRPARLVELDPVGVPAYDVELDLEPGDELEAQLSGRIDLLLEQMTAVERHRLAVGEVRVGDDPAGAVGPRQDPERRRVRNQNHVREAGELRDVEAAPWHEQRREHVVGSVHAEQRGREVDAVLQRCQVVQRRHELAPRLAVLVHPDHPDGAEPVLLDQLGAALARRLLRRGEQVVVVDEAVLADAPVVAHQSLHAGVTRVVRTCAVP